MGDIADMMLDGTLCEGCGVALDGDSPGHPRYCGCCRRERKADKHAATLANHQQVKKVPCPTCGRKVKACGLADHQRDAHGVAT
jgi:hypothetical protein